MNKHKYLFNKFLILSTLILMSFLVSCSTNSSKYTIYFHSNGGGKVDEIQTDGKSYIDLPVNICKEIQTPFFSEKKEFYIFMGWYYDDGTFKQEFNNDSLTKNPINNDLHVYAKWFTEFEYFFYMIGIEGLGSVYNDKRVKRLDIETDDYGTLSVDIYDDESISMDMNIRYDDKWEYFRLDTEYLYNQKYISFGYYNDSDKNWAIYDYGAFNDNFTGISYLYLNNRGGFTTDSAYSLSREKTIEIFVYMVNTYKSYLEKNINVPEPAC